MNVINMLESVLCGPDGKCCLAGSDTDRAVVDTALTALRDTTAQPPQQSEQPVADLRPDPKAVPVPQPPQQSAQPVKPYAYAVYFPDQQKEELAHELDDVCEDMTNDENHVVTPLYDHPVIAQPGGREYISPVKTVADLGFTED